MRFATIIPALVLLFVCCHEGGPPVESGNASRAMEITYLKKANDDVISFCTCGDGRMTFPAQMDCPWCGCGWLFTCMTCRKAFTFAEAVEIEGSWEDLAREDIENRWGEKASDDDVDAWVEAMQDITAGVRPGVRYAIIDGYVIPADAENVSFNGWHAHHEFAKLPQEEARSDKAVLDVQLSNRAYWTRNALPQN